jgi:PAS domain-containing protein
VTRREEGIAGPGFAESLVEESPDALIALSVEGKVLFWNKGAQTIFGYSRDEAIGRTIEDLVVPLDMREEARRKLAAEDALTTYHFNKKVIDHLFCSTCGVTSFARGKKPDGTPMVAVNTRCLDGVDVQKLEVTHFDGASR